GEPLEMIQAIPIVEGSLRLILNALQRRYGDKRAHYQRLLKELKDKKYSVPRTQAELKDWYYRLMIMRDSLVSSPSLSNVHSPGLLSENELFISHVLESLPEDIHRSIELHFEHSAIVPTVDDILSYLDSIIRSRESYPILRIFIERGVHFVIEAIVQRIAEQYQIIPGDNR
uniref:EscV/YscV/HrcV family type III secretion system export apparatus protein n=1 Tax=Bursaphelenchus xylophilus TaxID=6326 RepID=A0A1I7SP99_BURXY